MAYGASGLKLMSAGSGGLAGGPQLWYYTSVDAHGTVEGTAYFTDSGTGGKFPMRVGDVVIVVDSDTGPGNVTIHSVITLSATGASINPALLA